MKLFDQLLQEYKNKGTFSFRAGDKLGDKCNAPKNKSGIYVVYAVLGNEERIVYVGSSGSMQNDGQIKHRGGGMYDRIVNGKQFDKSRKSSWPQKMKEQEIDELRIYWCVTFENEKTNIPKYVEAVLLQEYFDKFAILSYWNKAF